MKGLSPEARLKARQALRKETAASVGKLTDTWVKAAVTAEHATDYQWEWFWFNHFNVFAKKGMVGVALPEYVESVIRGNMKGHFRDLLIAVLTQPAMLIYLDNTRNVQGKINENLARELLELHTLGVDGGYTQTDVENVALILTGFGIRPVEQIKWPANIKPQVVERGDFLFDPRKHDFSTKHVLGTAIPGTGYTEIERLADRLAAHPSTARHLAKKLCGYYWGDTPPEPLIKKVERTYIDTRGNLQEVMTVVLTATQEKKLSQKDATQSFKTPIAWVLSSVRWLAQGQELKDAALIQRWLMQLGEPLWDCVTPNGYSVLGAKWVGSGQMAQRFYLAREMVAFTPRLFGKSFTPRLYQAQLARAQSSLPQQVSATIDEADTNELKAALWLGSPVFMYRRPGEVW